MQENRLEEAQALCEQVLRTNRADVETLSLLGTIYRTLGRLDEAENYGRMALQHGSNRGEAHYALGVTLQRQGKMHPALECFKSATRLKPEMMDAHFQLGNTLRELNLLDQAIGSFRIVLSADPKHVPALCNLGGTLAALHRYDEAIALLNKAHMLMPQAIPVLCNMARVLQSLGRPEEAESRCREALRLNPQAVDAMSVLVELLERSHRLAEARELIQRGLSIVPGHFLLRYAAATLARSEGRYQDAIALAEGLLGDSPSADSQFGLHYLLGQLYDRLDDTGRAYTHFTEANRAVAAAYTANERHSYLRKIEQRRKQFQARQAVEIKVDDDQDSPAFLVGFPRSGTTLLEQILDSHPRIQAMDERPTVAVMAEAYDLMVSRRPDAANALTPDEIRELRQAYFSEASKHVALKPGQLLVDKLPLNLIQTYFIWRIFPRAKFILAIRHPCDVVLSCFMQNFTLNQAMTTFTSLTDSAAAYAGAMSLWQEYATQLPLKYHRIRYEDVVDSVEQEARQLLAFLDIEWNDAVLAHVDHARQRGAISTPSYHQVTQPIYRHAAYRWQRYARELEPIMQTLQPFITDFGYGDTRQIRK